MTFYECLKAQKTLAEQGINVAVIDLFAVKPLDVQTIRFQAQRVGGLVVTSEDHYSSGGIGEAVSAALAQEKNTKVVSLSIKELPRSGPPNVLLDFYGVSAPHIVKAVKNNLA